MKLVDIISKPIVEHAYKKPAAPKAKAKVIENKKGKTKKKMVGEETEIAPKLIHLTPKFIMPESPRIQVAQYYVKKIDAAEKKTHMVANVSKYMDPLSSGFLSLDWLFNGGQFNGMCIVSGLEGTGKTTLQNHMIASGLRHGLLFNANMDAEGTMNEEYAAAMFAQMGIDFIGLDKLAHRPYRYYKENVIEPIFDYIHFMLKAMPQKIWLQDENSWAYIFEKGNSEESAKMEAYGVEPHSRYSNAQQNICLTEHSGLEGGFYIDSFAAMVTESDDDADQKGKRRAAEAAAFSEHLRRVSARLSNRGCFIFGVNQLGQTPGQVYGDQFYEKGGQALKYYSSQRARFSDIASNLPGADAKWMPEFKAIVEPSVIVPGAFDMYAYKKVKNTKNKMGNPKKETWVRVWVADHNGNAHGFDPAFDLYNYLMESNQLVKARGGKNGKNLTFKLRKSVGNNRAALLNALPPFAERDLKALTLSEVFPSRELIQRALSGMGLSKQVGLREALFEQIKKDKTVLAIKTQKKVKESKDVEGVTEY